MATIYRRLWNLRQTGNNATESEKPSELTVKLSTTEGELKGIRGVTHGFDGATARAELAVNAECGQRWGEDQRMQAFSL